MVYMFLGGFTLCIFDRVSGTGTLFGGYFIQNICILGMGVWDGGEWNTAEIGGSQHDFCIFPGFRGNSWFQIDFQKIGSAKFYQVSDKYSKYQGFF